MDQPFGAGPDQGLSRPLNPTHKETSALPAPIDLRGVPAPKTPKPFHGDQPYAVWMRAILSKLDYDSTVDAVLGLVDNFCPKLP